MNINDVIIDERELTRREALIDEVLSGRKEYNLRTLEPASKQALGRHLLFAEPDARERAGFGAISDAQAFYNSYYWFLIFSKIYQEKNGYDAGVEQKSFKILERIPPDGDWKIVEKITEAANQHSL